MRGRKGINRKQAKLGIGEGDNLCRRTSFAVAGGEKSFEAGGVGEAWMKGSGGEIGRRPRRSWTKVAERLGGDLAPVTGGRS